MRRDQKDGVGASATDGRRPRGSAVELLAAVSFRRAVLIGGSDRRIAVWQDGGAHKHDGGGGGGGAARRRRHGGGALHTCAFTVSDDEIVLLGCTPCSRLSASR